MTHDAYSTKRVTVWAQEKDGVAGKAIQYADGYVSWCPDAVYARDYQPITALGFGHALHALKAGKRVARAGWNGKGMWLVRVGQGHYDVATGKTDGASHLKAWYGLKTADDGLVPWQPSQTDLDAEDWLILGEV